MRTYGPKVSDSSGNATVFARGYGFAVIPIGPTPTKFPVVVTPRNIDGGAPRTITGPDLVSFTEEFQGLDFTGMGNSSTFQVVVKTSPLEKVDLSVAATAPVGVSVAGSIQTNGAANAPTGDPNINGATLGNSGDGSLPITGNKARVIVRAPAGQTITGGALKFWYWDQYTAKVWGLLSLELQGGNANTINLPTGNRCAVVDLPLGVSAGFIYFEASNVTISSGSNVNVDFYVGNN